MAEFKQMLAAGQLQQAYQGLLAFFRNLQRDLAANYPDLSVSGNLYQGYLDMTYFALAPKFLRTRDLKCPLVFNYQEFNFEVWLSGMNRTVQAEYWSKFRAADFPGFELAKDPKREDLLLRRVLIETPDFNDLEILAQQIEQGLLNFLSEVEAVLDEIDP